MSVPRHAVDRPSPRTLRLDAFATRWERLRVAAQRHGVDEHDLVLPAEGLLLRASGPALHYLEWPGQSADVPDLLMLHGGGLHAHTFDLTANLLRRRARCVALDLRGHGESGWVEPSDYGSDAICQDIDAVVTALDLKNVVLVGHSLGGMAAMVWASRRPPVLRGLAVIDVAPEMQQAGIGSVGDFVTTAQSFADLEELDTYLAEAFPSNTPRSDGMAANLRWSDDGTLTFKYDNRQFMAMKLALHDELRHLVREIDCPTLVLRGERSKVTSAAAATELAELIPGATWTTIANAGHTIQSSNPVGLAAQLASFLNGLAPSNTTSDRTIR